MVRIYLICFVFSYYLTYLFFFPLFSFVFVFGLLAGDSRGIIVQRGGRARHMSVDHKPNRDDEEARIKKLGGKVVFWGRWRVMGVLAVSRSVVYPSIFPIFLGLYYCYL